MARTVAELPKGARITDYISLGVLTKAFPLDRVNAAVAAGGKTSQRQRDLPAHVVVYYVVALTLYMQVSYREVLRCLLEGIKWLLGPEWEVKVAGKSGISQARTRLGWEPLKQLHDEMVAPIAVKRTKGAWYRDWRLVSVDGSTLEVADNQANEKALSSYEPARVTALTADRPECSMLHNSPAISLQRGDSVGVHSVHRRGCGSAGTNIDSESASVPTLLDPHRDVLHYYYIRLIAP